MAILAIKGHGTRGKEVIELLETLGGNNYYKLDGSSWGCMYHINQNGNISVDTSFTHQTFSLDGFLAKFPYKVGDKVIFKDHIEIINRMRWDGETIRYGFFTARNVGEARVEDLQPYKEQEEIMKENKTKITFDCNQVDNGVELIIPQGMELFVQDGKVVLIDKKPKYPKTFKECCKVLSYDSIDEIKGYRRLDLEYLQTLLVCRDAYWKLDGDWRPDRESVCYDKFYIKNAPQFIKELLPFPNAEARDAFYENFKGLIEIQKLLQV